MAENNTVPLGQAGTGSAFVLGENQALDRYLRNEDYNTQVARQSALLKQRAKAEADQQRLADYTKNALNVKAGLVFRDVDDQAKAVIEKGKELYQRGVNPWQPYTGNDPNVRSEVEDLQRQRLMTEANAERREALQPLLLKEMTSYDPSKHTRSSFDRLNKYTQLPASEAFTQAPPTLQPKLQPNLVLDKVKLGKVGTDLVVGNRRIKKEGLDYNTARGAIVDQFKNEAALDDFLQEDLGIQGYTVDALEKLPKTFEGIKESAMKEYNGNPKFREELAGKLGITSPAQFEQVATQKAIEAYDAKQKYETFMDRATKSKLVELGSSYSNTPDTTAEDQQFKRNREARAASEDNGSNSVGNVQVVPKVFYTAGTYNDTTGKREGQKKAVEFAKFAAVNPIQITTPQLSNVYDVASGQNVSTKAIESGKITGIGWALSKGGVYKLKVAIVDKNDKEILLNYQDIPLKAKEDKYLKSIVSELGDAPSKQKVATKADIKALVGKKGYEGYTQKELEDHYRSKGYTIK